VLVRAAERVLREQPDTGFVLFGEGPERARLLKQINAAGLGQSFILAGFRADLDRFLPHFDLLVLPSNTEGMPNVVLEAFAAGVPVVATAVGGTPEIIEEGVSGYLVPSGDDEAMAERICLALDNADALPDMGRKGRLYVQEKFGFATQADLYRELFEQLRPDFFESEESDFEENGETAALPTEQEENDGKPTTPLDDDFLTTESTCSN
jgi:glycosyltransferase involved in cell wall biosynthesis